MSASSDVSQAEPVMSINASRGHQVAAGIWLGILFMLILPNLALFPMELLYAHQTTLPSGVAQVFGSLVLILLLVAVILPFPLALRSHLALSAGGLRVVPMIGEARTYRWSDIRSFSVVQHRPGWLLGLSRWSVVQAELTSGETITLGPTERHRAQDATMLRDRLAATLPSRPALRENGVVLPKVYRATVGERVLQIFYDFIGVMIFAGIGVGIVIGLAGSLVPHPAPVAPVSAPAGQATADPASIGPAVGILVWVFLVPLFIISRRERVVASPTGLEIVPLFGRARRVPWTQIQGFTVVTTHPYPGRYSSGAPYSTVVAQLENGRSLELAATQREGASPVGVNQARNELAAALAQVRGWPAEAPPLTNATAATAQPSAGSATLSQASAMATGGRNGASWLTGTAPVRLAIELFGSCFFVIAASSEIVNVVGGEDFLSPFAAAIFTASLLLIGIAVGLAAFHSEASLRRSQPVAIAFAQRHVNSIVTRILPVRSYAPIVAGIEALVLLVTAARVAPSLPTTIASGSTSLTILVAVALLGWLALVTLYGWAIIRMLAFRRARGVSATALPGAG